MEGRVSQTLVSRRIRSTANKFRSPVPPPESQGLGFFFFLILIYSDSDADVPSASECVLSFAQLFVTGWTAAWQAALSMGFSRQKYWSALPFPRLGNLPNPEIKLASPVSPALAGRFFITVPSGKPQLCQEPHFKNPWLECSISDFKIQRV